MGSCLFCKPTRSADWLLQKAAGLAVLVGVLGGCGPALVYSSILQAEQQVDRAEYMGAPDSAPYEYFQAVEYLAKARREVAEGDYGSAKFLSQLALRKALLAVEAAKKLTQAPAGS